MRLIDADKLIEELTIKAVSKDAHIISIANAVVNFVNNQPTAYDVDKVVEELEERKALHERLVDYETKNGAVTEKYQNIKAIDVLNKAIEIVKQGGVCGGCTEVGGCPVREDCPNEPNVCEWKCKGGFIKNPHTNRIYSNEESMKNIYCNTCGKKIKAVE